MKVLIACECSGIFRDAFVERGHDAWSCDLKPDEQGSNRHIRGDVLDHLNDGWDALIVCHPPCTRLCNSGVRWLYHPSRGRTVAENWADLETGAALFSALWNAPIPRIAMENPVMHHHAKARIANWRPAHFVQPWWFGDPFFKATGWTLKALPRLQATDRLIPPRPGTEEHARWSRVHRMPPGPTRSAERARSFPGMAAAAADQWGRIVA
jgi:hypothetical protein